MLEDMKILLGITSSERDELLELLLSMAQREAIQYTGNDDVSSMRTIIIKMAIYNYNRLGTEGLASESYSGNSYSYETDYPESILRSLKSFRKLRLL